MATRRWSIPRLLLIWLAWPVILLALSLVTVSLGYPVSIDLLHGVGLLAALVLGPPLLASILWGRK